MEWVLGNGGMMEWVLGNGGMMEWVLGNGGMCLSLYLPLFLLHVLQ